MATGYRERFDVTYVPRGSPLRPALVTDLWQVKGRRQEPSARKEEGQPAVSVAAARQSPRKKAQEAPSTEDL